MSEEETHLVDYRDNGDDDEVHVEDSIFEDPANPDGENEVTSPVIAKNGARHSRSKSHSRSKRRRSSKKHSKRRRRSTSSSSARSKSSSSSRGRRHKRSRRRKRSRSHSKSRSRSRSHRRRHRRSRTRSRSRSRSANRFPRSRFMGPREAPPPSRCLGIFGLNETTSEVTLAHILGAFGKIERINIIYDGKSNRSRGFGFVYFATVEDAIEAKERMTGIEIDGFHPRSDFSLTKRPHTPTPGVYMGKPTSRGDYRGGSGYGSGYGAGGYDGRSASPSYSRRRSRSRSYS